ncbi:MAG: GvpL/GvpF family gas vesicle protein [Pseudomonadota bacterium]
MSVYLFGIVRADMAPAATEAIAQAQGSRDLDAARALRIGQVALLLSDVLVAEIKPNRRNLLAHMRALEAMQTLGDVLPARFGQIFENDTALTALIAPRGATIEAELERLSGLTEISARVATRRETAVAALTAEHPELRQRYREIAAKGDAGHFELIELGRETATQLQAWRGTAEAVLVSALRQVAIDYRQSGASEDTELLRADFLIARAQLSAFEQALGEALKELPLLTAGDVEARLVGPAPPASFVRIDFSDLGAASLGSAA